MRRLRLPLGSIALLLAAAAVLTTDPLAALADDPPSRSPSSEPALVASPTPQPEPSPDPSPAPEPSPDPSTGPEPSPEGSVSPTPSGTPTASPAPESPKDDRPTRGAAGSATAAATDNRFEPMELTVAAGTRVVWTNVGQNPHTVTANERAFDSGTLESGETFAVSFDDVGRVPYYCQIHGEPGSGMFGLVIVRPAQDDGKGAPPTGSTDDLAATGLDPTSLALLAGSLGVGLLSLLMGRARSGKGGEAIRTGT